MAPKAAEGSSQEEVLDADAPDYIVKARGVRPSIGQWIEIRAAEPELTNAQIAARIGVSTRTLQRYISKAVSEGWLVFEDAMDRVNFELVPKIITGYSALLDNKDARAIIEGAKGTIFPAYQKSIGATDSPQMLLALKIEPAGDTKAEVTGHIVGQARLIESTE